MSSAIVIATIYIGLNMTLSALASWLDHRPFAPRERRTLAPREQRLAPVSE